MKKMSVEETLNKFPWLRKLDKKEVMEAFLDMSRMMMLPPENEEKGDLFYGLVCLLQSED